jgi:hypothetical protein
MIAHSLETLAEDGQEFGAQSSTLRLIPLERGPDVMFSPSSKDELPGH